MKRNFKIMCMSGRFSMKVYRSNLVLSEEHNTSDILVISKLHLKKTHKYIINPKIKKIQNHVNE